MPLNQITKPNVTKPNQTKPHFVRLPLFPLVLLKGRINELTKIVIVFNLEVLLTTSDEENPCAVSRGKKTVVVLRRKKDAEFKAGVDMLSSGQELKC